MWILFFTGLVLTFGYDVIMLIRHREPVSFAKGVVAGVLVLIGIGSRLMLGKSDSTNVFIAWNCVGLFITLGKLVFGRKGEQRRPSK